MKAIVQVSYGSPDGLELREIEKPTVSEDRVLVRVRAAWVNAADWHLMKRLPHIVGRFFGMRPSRVRRGDLGGVVEAVGKKVARFQPGDEVFGSGTGTFAVQIARALGARVTAVTSTANLDLLRSIGAEEAIDYTKEDFTRRSERWDVVFDIGADRSFAELRRVLSPDGKVVLCGAPSSVWLALAGLVKAQLMSRAGSRQVSYVTRIRQSDLLALKDLAEAGKLVPVIDRQYPLSKAPEAVRYIGTKQAHGKVVISIG